MTSDNWLVVSLGALATFVATLVLWTLKRNADREDRMDAARKDYTDSLAELPSRLEALVARVDGHQKQLDETRAELAEVQRAVAVVQSRVNP